MLRLAIFLLTTTLLVSGSVVRHHPKLQKTVHPFTVVGKCPEHEEGIPTYLEDSEKCNVFYECTNGKPEQLFCPGELQWDPVHHVCDSKENVNCEKGQENLKAKVIRPYSPLEGNKEGSCEKQNLKAIGTYSPVGECPVPAGQNPVYLPDSNDCTIFYECDGAGNPCTKHCPSGTQFNPVLHVCDMPESAGCTAGGSKFVMPEKPKAIHTFSPVGECHGHEDGKPTFLPDSVECDTYYECTNGVPIQNFCTGGLQWNTAIDSCDYPDQANCQAGKTTKTPN